MSDYSLTVEDDVGGTLLRLRTIPRAKTTRLEGVYGRAARLRVAAPPADGRANAAMVVFLAAALRVRQADLELVHGKKSRDKTVRVHGLDAASVAARLRAAEG